MLPARVAGRAAGVVLVGLIGDDDQRQHHARGRAAHAAPGLGERLVDGARGGVGQVDGHRGFPPTGARLDVRALRALTGAAMRARSVPSSPRPTRGPPNPPDTAPAWYKRPRNPPPGPGSASPARLPAAWGTAAGRR